jgi:hypothetical protein
VKDSVLRLVKEQVADHPKAPEGIELYHWHVVHASHVPVLLRDEEDLEYQVDPRLEVGLGDTVLCRVGWHIGERVAVCWPGPPIQ